MNIIKKTVSILIIVCVLCSGILAFAAAETIKINGTVTNIPPEMGSIKEKDDRTFVPVRFILENLGCTVDYVEDTKTAVISSISSTYLIQEGNSILYVLPNQYTETQNIQMDTSAFIETTVLDGQEYGRMYIPIRFLAEAIGYTVGWEEETQTVTLTMTN